MNHAKNLQDVFNHLMMHDTRPHDKRGVGKRFGQDSRLSIKKVKVQEQGAGVSVVNQTQVNPTDSGPLVNLGYPIWETGGPVITDINQGYLADCYFLAALGALANTVNGRKYLQTILIPDPDVANGVICIYTRNGVQTRIHCDILVNNTTGNTSFNDLWPEIFEKTYALFRSGADTYASLNYGNAVNVFMDLACTPSNGYNYDQKFDLIRTALANQIPITASTPIASGQLPNLIENHVYTITGIDANNNVQFYNPWGIWAPDQNRIVAPADFVTKNFSGIQYGTTPFVAAPVVDTVGILRKQVARYEQFISSLDATINAPKS